MTDVVEKFGKQEPFAIQIVPWYQGDFEYFLEIMELWVNKEGRVEVAPYLFGYIMGELWNGGSAMTAGHLALQVVSYDKVRVGSRAIGKQQFLAVLPNLLSLGLTVNVELIGEWINELLIDKMQ